ncbi:YlbF family regulator [Macrococcus equi]|uniref:YlbF family regulator n=2 Tax=Macrococcus equi TaxID=3395462 RepID=UPI0039BDB7E2
MTNMIYDNEILAVIERSENLNKMLLNSEAYLQYKQLYIELEDNAEVQQLKKDLIKLKGKYDEVNRFGRYHPDYQKVMLETRRKKKEYEMHPEVAHLKQLEMNLQTLLDEVIVIVTQHISTNIKVETGNPFFESHTCSSGCGCS